MELGAETDLKANVQTAWAHLPCFLLPLLPCPHCSGKQPNCTLLGVAHGHSLYFHVCLQIEGTGAGAPQVHAQCGRSAALGDQHPQPVSPHHLDIGTTQLIHPQSRHLTNSICVLQRPTVSWLHSLFQRSGLCLVPTLGLAEPQQSEIRLWLKRQQWEFEIT